MNRKKDFLGVKCLSFGSVYWGWNGQAEGHFTLEKSHTPLAKILLFSSKINERSLEVLLFGKISCAVSNEWSVHRGKPWLKCVEQIFRWILLTVIIAIIVSAKAAHGHNLDKLLIDRFLAINTIHFTPSLLILALANLLLNSHQYFLTFFFSFSQWYFWSGRSKNTSF